MNLILRLVVAIVIGVIVASVLDYFGVLTSHINALIGFVVAVIAFYSWDGRTF